MSSKKQTPVQIKDADTIFEELVGINRDEYKKTLDDLVEVGFIVKHVDDNEDRTYYRSRDGLSWTDIVIIDSPIKKQILLTLIINPTTFFVLYNTQKGKLKIVADEIRDWSKKSDKKVVAFLIVDNDKTLADQSKDGVFKSVEGVAKMFVLSSNSAEVTFDGIRAHIDAYAAGVRDYQMPVIVALNNATQLKKVISLMNHIKTEVNVHNSPLRFGFVVDEADKVYPKIRTKFMSLLVEDNSALHRLGFVTATEGELIESEYPECTNAHMYPVPEGSPDYRAIHTPDASIRRVESCGCVGICGCGSRKNKDIYALTIISENRDHFSQSITLKNGFKGFRKTIVNSDRKTASMESFACKCVADGYYAMTVNMYGITVYRPGYDKPKKYSTKGHNFGKLLFEIYQELNLHDKPLFIIGCRKVDRGLSFHYAPRDGSDGLVWTDMILGSIDDKDTATQKAGRLAGVVAQCPQYPGTLTWWTDDMTAKTVSYHNTMVDAANTKLGCSMLQALTRAESDVQDLTHDEKTDQPKADDPNEIIMSESFETIELAKSWGEKILRTKPSKMTVQPGNVFRYRNYDRPIESEQKTRDHNDKSAGLGAIKKNGTKSYTCRAMPVFDGNGNIRYVVIYKRFMMKSFTDE